MPRKKGSNAYNVYRQTLYHKSKSGYRFACRECSTLLLPTQYERHCTQMHQLKANLNCVWCRNVSWPSREKRLFGAHLLQCFKKFMLLDATPIHPSDGIRLVSVEHEFLERHLYGISHLPTPEYDNLWPLIVKKYALLYRDENLNLATSYVWTYLQIRHDYDFIHVMVRAYALESFVQALNEDAGITRTLQFSCWCNGGTHPEPECRQHRHWVVVTPKGHFQSVFWPKVKGRTVPKVRCKAFKKMASALHLVYTLGYLSRRNSNCKFSFECKNAKFEDEDMFREWIEDTLIAERTPQHFHHFYLYKTLPKTYELFLVLLWKGGLEELLYTRKFQNVSVSRLVKHPMQYVEGKYQQRIKDFYNHEQHMVLPVQKQFVASKQATPIFLHLMKGKKLYFKKSQETMDDDTWLLCQKMGGNSFYDNVEEEFWTPRQRDQKMLSLLVPVVEENDQLKSKNVQLQTEKDQLQTEKDQLQTEKDQLQSKNDQLQTKYDQLENEHSNMKLENTIHILKLEKEIIDLKGKYENSQLKTENTNLKRKCEELENEIISLNGKCKEFDIQNKSLKRKCEELEIEICSLKRTCV